MGKDILSERTVMVVKVDNSSNNTSRSSNNDDRPATTPAAVISTKGKNAFRFPRFSLKSPSTVSQQSAATPGSTSSPTTTTTSSNAAHSRTSRRLRSFPLLRLRSMPVDVSETSVNTSLSPSPAAAPSGSSAASSSSTSTANTASTGNSPTPTGTHNNNNNPTTRRRKQQQREAREDYVIRCTKIYSTTTTGEQEGFDKANANQQQHHQLAEQAERPQPQSSPPSHPPPPHMSSPSGSIAEEDHPDLSTDFQQQQQQEPPPFACTAILQHSYLEMVCGKPNHALVDDLDYNSDSLGGSASSQTTGAAAVALPLPNTSRRRIPDDPTVQDSIECVFASQLEEGLPLWEDDNDDDDELAAEHRDEQEHAPLANLYTEEPINAPSEAELPSPAPLMQSRQKSRRPLPAVTKAMIPSKRRSHPSNNNNASSSSRITGSSSSGGGSGHQADNNHKKGKQPKFGGLSSPTRRRKKYQTAKMVHVGTFDPRTNRILEVAETDHNLMEEDPAVRVAPVQSPPRTCKSCFCHSHSVPIVPETLWPQAPLLLRPTPNEGMTVKGIRFSGKTEHFWKPSDGGWWLTPLYELAGKEAPTLPPDVPSMCPQCCLLPINNGNEPIGEALVTDFETPLFEGSLLVRLRHVDGGATMTDPNTAEYNDNVGYFAGLNRRYQVVIRGKFKNEIPFTDLVAGSVMNRPYGRLPPKWIMKGAIKVLSFFAPQLQVELDGDSPKTMAPLGSTPQALIVQQVGPQDVLPPLDAAVEEPTQASEALMGTAYPGSTSLQRARGRKKAFDKLFSTQSQSIVTKTSARSKETYYTFEFLQHLVNFQEFSVELGNLLGSIPIAPILSGAPIPIMAMVKESEQKLWSFDLWHLSLVEGAKEHDAQNGSNDYGNKKQ